ncbi:LPS export ABC transporter periplasmic protein LptC [Parvibaculum sp.]|uniref:LPS export ABC transporter periplasmic protein LptC n=1 Tax=Parvibaculum sp. TaxID=2024848 RepID=UPI00320F253B
MSESLGDNEANAELRRGPQPQARPAVARHSRFVSTMKIALPLGAVALFATVLIYSGAFDTHDKLDISFREISTPNNDLRMVSPRVTGLDGAGRPYVLTADTATQAPGKPNHVTLDNVQADLKLENDADWVSLSSTTGLFDTETQTLDLSQKIDIYASTGYEFHGTSVEVDLRKGIVSSRAPVEGHGPLGTLRADSMTADNANRTLNFKGRVKVRIYGQEGKGK